MKMMAALEPVFEKITKALDHLMKDLKMDCDVCKLKDVCEEVEQLSLQEK